MMASSKGGEGEANDVQINIQDDPNVGMQTNLASSDTSHANDSATVPFVPSQLFNFARRALEIADYYGEKLAYFFGITSPKYEAEIREYERRVTQGKTDMETEANEYSGWSTQSNMNVPPTVTSNSPVTFTPGPDPPPRY